MLFPLCEEINGIVDGHVEHVGNILAVEPHFEDVALEALAMAMLALKNEVGHKLHLDGDDACSLTFIAASAIGIEGEILGGEAHLMRQGLVGIEVADGIIGLDIGGGIGTGALTYRVLVNKLYMLHCLDIATKRGIFARGIAHLTDMALEGGIKDSLDKTRLARTAHSGDYCHHIERKGYINSLEIVHTRSLDLYLHIPRTTTRWNGDCFLTGEIF